MIKQYVRARDGGYVKLGLTHAKAIKVHCTECCGWEFHPKDCPSINCALYPFRGLVKSTAKKGLGTHQLGGFDGLEGPKKE